MASNPLLGYFSRRQVREIWSVGIPKTPLTNLRSEKVPRAAVAVDLAAPIAPVALLNSSFAAPPQTFFCFMYLQIFAEFLYQPRFKNAFICRQYG